MVEVVERQVSVFVVGSNESLQKMGGCAAVFPSLGLGQALLGGQIRECGANEPRTCVVLALDDGEINFIDALNQVIERNSSSLTDLLIVKSAFGRAENLSEDEFYRRWQHFTVPHPLVMTDSSDCLIDREVSREIDFNDRKIFVKFGVSVENFSKLNKNSGELAIGNILKIGHNIKKRLYMILGI